MAQGLVSPLALTAGVGCYNNTVIQVNAAFTTNTAAYEALSPIANLLFTIDQAASNLSLSISAGTLADLQTLGANVSGNYCPALGDSIPSNVSGISVANVGLTGLQTVSAAQYLGNGNFSVFAQAFGAAQGFIGITNQVITSAARANEYLGPTFVNMDDLIAADVTRINLATQAFGQDLAALGLAIDLGSVDTIGTPAALLQALSQAGNMPTGTLPAVRDALLDQGLTLENIKDLVTNNRESLFNPTGLSETQFDALQKRAYPALCMVTGADLADVLAILEVTTANITRMCDLLDPVKIFPNSFSSLTLPTPQGDILIYSPTGAVNSDVEQVLNSGSLVPRGCDQLGKIEPPDQAVANRALQVAFAQVKGITSITLPELAEILS